MKATITSKGQITIPAKVRRRLNLKPGHVLEFDESAPCLKASRVFDPGEMYGTIGCCKNMASPAGSAGEWLDQTRGRVKLPKDKRAHGG
jgi:AbrB family looped-hinge helix DNA binding protein